MSTLHSWVGAIPPTSVWSIATIQMVIQIGLPMVKPFDIRGPHTRWPLILILNRTTPPYSETDVVKRIAFNTTPGSFSVGQSSLSPHRRSINRKLTHYPEVGSDPVSN